MNSTPQLSKPQTPTAEKPHVPVSVVRYILTHRRNRLAEEAKKPQVESKP